MSMPTTGGKLRLIMVGVVAGGVVSLLSGPGAAEAYTRDEPDMSCMEVRYEFGGPVRPTRCRAMTVGVEDRKSSRPTWYRARLRDASWTIWNARKAIGSGRVRTHRQPWVDIRIRLSHPRRVVYNLDPPRPRWLFTRFEFKYQSRPNSRWLDYRGGDACDSFSSVYC